jgi:hypothetical protein
VKKLNVSTTYGSVNKSWGVFMGHLYKSKIGDSYWSISKVQLSRVTLILPSNTDGLSYNDYYIKTYNKELMETGMQKLIIQNYGIETYLWKFVKVKDKVLALFITRDTESEKKILSAGEINTTKFEVESELIELAKIDWKTGKGKNVKQFNLENEFQSHIDGLLVISSGSSMRIDNHFHSSLDKTIDRPRFINSVWVFDENLNAVNQLSSAMYITRETEGYPQQKVEIDRDGTILAYYRNFLLLSKNGEPSERILDPYYPAFNIVRKTPQGKEDTLETAVGKLITDARVIMGANDSLNLIVLNSKQVRGKLLTTGLARFHINNQNFTLSKQSESTFDEELLNKVNNLRESGDQTFTAKIGAKKSDLKQELIKEERNALLNVNSISSVVIDNYGNPVVLLEEFYVETQNTIQSDGWDKTTYRYHFNDIIICKFENDKISFDYLKKKQTFGRRVRFVKLDAHVTSNNELQFQTLGSVVRFPLNGKSILAAITVPDPMIMVRKKARKFRTGSIIYLDDTEVLVFYWRLLRNALVRTVIED